MVLSPDNILLIGAVLIASSILISKVGFKVGMPTLLLFLAIGMITGSDGLGIQFHNAAEAQFIGMIALSIILFTGGLETKYRAIKPIVREGVVLSTLGVILTMLFTGLFIYLMACLLGLPDYISLPSSFLLAATMSSTDSASVFNILGTQNIKLKYNLRPMLELESGSNDPVAYLLTIILIQATQISDVTVIDIVITFFWQLLAGAIGGIVFAKATVWVVNNLKLANQSLSSILVLCFIIFTYSLTNMIGGNGYLAVYIAGIVVGNAELVHKKSITVFLDAITWLCQIVMFIMLGLLVNPLEMLEIAPAALLIGLFLILVGRPLSVFICLAPFKRQTLRSKLFISWVGLRGAVPIIFATYPVVANVDGSRQIFNIVFFITILSLVIQGSTVSYMAKKLHLDEKTEPSFTNKYR